MDITGGAGGSGPVTKKNVTSVVTQKVFENPPFGKPSAGKCTRGGGGDTALLSFHGIQCHSLSSLNASAGMQHQFCRLDHMCKEFSCGPLYCGKMVQQSLQQITQTVYNYQIPAVAKKMCSGSRNSHSDNCETEAVAMDIIDRR